MCYNADIYIEVNRSSESNFLIDSKREVFDMTENLIKDVKKIQQALINKESIGDEFEEKMEAVHKLEEVADYLKDALGRGIEF